MRQDRKSLPILYTYDSILFDVDPSDGDEYILEIKKVMESDGFPTDVEIGDNYKDMVKTNL